MNQDTINELNELSHILRYRPGTPDLLIIRDIIMI